MKQALILLSLVAFALTTNAQRAKVTTAILSIDANDFGKAKSNIDDAVLDEKTSVDPKAWFYRGQIYQHLSQIALGTYVWKPGVPIEQPEIEEYKVLAENPAQTAFESYKKDPLLPYASSVHIIELIGLVVSGWLMFRSLTVASDMLKNSDDPFYQHKIDSCLFFSTNLLTKTQSLRRLIIEGSEAIILPKVSNL